MAQRNGGAAAVAEDAKAEKTPATEGDVSKINLSALKRAIEALFTPHQLATNPALSAHMTTVGAVPLGALAQLPEISAHLQGATDATAIVEAVKSSQLVQVADEGLKPKPAARSTIIIRELPDSVEEKDIREEFKDFAESIVEVRKDTGLWYVMLSSEKDAKDCATSRFGKSLHGAPLKLRIKSEASQIAMNLQRASPVQGTTGLNEARGPPPPPGGLGGFPPYMSGMPYYGMPPPANMLNGAMPYPYAAVPPPGGPRGTMGGGPIPVNAPRGPFPAAPANGPPGANGAGGAGMGAGSGGRQQQQYMGPGSRPPRGGRGGMGPPGGPPASVHGMMAMMGANGLPPQQLPLPVPPQSHQGGPQSHHHHQGPHNGSTGMGKERGGDGMYRKGERGGGTPGERSQDGSRHGGHQGAMPSGGHSTNSGPRGPPPERTVSPTQAGGSGGGKGGKAGKERGAERKEKGGKAGKSPQQPGSQRQGGQQQGGGGKKEEAAEVILNRPGDFPALKSDGPPREIKAPEWGITAPAITSPIAPIVKPVTPQPPPEPSPPPSAAQTPQPAKKPEAAKEPQAQSSGASTKKKGADGSAQPQLSPGRAASQKAAPTPEAPVPVKASAVPITTTPNAPVNPPPSTTEPPPPPPSSTRPPPRPTPDAAASTPADPAPPKKAQPATPSGPWAAAVLRSSKPIDPNTPVRLPVRPSGPKTSGAPQAPASAPAGPPSPTKTAGKGGAKHAGPTKREGHGDSASKADGKGEGSGASAEGGKAHKHPDSGNGHATRTAKAGHNSGAAPSSPARALSPSDGHSSGGGGGDSAAASEASAYPPRRPSPGPWGKKSFVDVLLTKPQATPPQPIDIKPSNEGEGDEGSA